MPRRSFLTAAAAVGLSPRAFESVNPTSSSPKVDPQVDDGRFDPWVEVEPAALRHNVQQVGALTQGTPILAVVKNNAYGLDLVTAARILEPMPEISGFAVVKTEAALALRSAGITKPVLHMGLANEADGIELARQQVAVSLYTDGALERVRSLSAATGAPVEAHAYLDTGMGRMGMPYHRALPWLQELTEDAQVRLLGTYMGFTEEDEFDREQLRRFEAFLSEAKQAGIRPGDPHAASSSAVYELPEAHLGLVRPGLALFGGYPNNESQRAQAELRCAFRLRARVVRVERLRVGDSVSYGRNYVAEEPTWIATIPAGHVDGVPRQAVNGGRVLIRNQTYPVIGAVSASHCIVELGRTSPVGVGDVATIMGPDHEDIVPDRLSSKTGVSIYDLFMHLNPSLPRIVV